jgi:hypothetical protein
VSKKETDILLIRKYLNGELDAPAMHQLEKRAQDDPFLMDALEGYENAPTNQQANLDDLAGRLQKRITPKQRRIIPYRTLAIAASVLIVFTIGLLWLSNDHKPTPPTTAKIAEPVEKPAPTKPVAADMAINNQIAANIAVPPGKSPKKAVRRGTLREAVVADKTMADNMIVSAEPAEAKADTVAADTTPLNEMVVMNYTAPKKKDVKENVQAAEESKFKSTPPVSTERVLQSQVAGVTKTPANSPFSALSSNIILQGRIVDKNDGMALPGVSVRVQGTKFGAVTDNNGKFSIPADSTRSSIVIAYIGYNTVKVSARNRDSLKTIRLEPNNQSLSEVVVVGYGSQKKEDGTVTAAHPQAGWHSFKKYLNENAVSPDDKKGIVKLSLMIDNNGNISEVTVIKGLSPATNKKAIDLINNGPDWIGSSNGLTEQVEVSIKFVSKK